MRKMSQMRNAKADGTADKLIAAAAREFKAHGYGGTDTNRIAARAGFAPQTFYRHFSDKLEIFAAVYRHWEDEEAAAIAALAGKRAGALALAEAIVAHHRAYLLFRRSLRALSLEHPAMRKARAESRLRQMKRIIADTGSDTVQSVAPILFQIERLADAIAEVEFADLGLAEKAGLEALAELLSRLRRVGRKSP
jgi:AcrR family transcriptional regulator